MHRKTNFLVNLYWDSKYLILILILICIVSLHCLIKISVPFSFLSCCFYLVSECWQTHLFCVCGKAIIIVVVVVKRGREKNKVGGGNKKQIQKEKM